MQRALLNCLVFALFVGCSDDPIKKLPPDFDAGADAEFDAGRDSGTPIDMSSPNNAVCGDGVVDAQEACDGQPTQSCSDFGFVSGMLLCTNCQLDTSLCVSQSCGDGVVDPGEACDGPPAESCTDVGFDRGTLQCTNCQLDTAQCINNSCGDGVVDGNEQCEGSPTESCTDVGFDGGTLLCTNCQLDTSQCTVFTCGDGVVNGNEVCDDGSENNGDYGFCNANCTGPGPRCGDGTINGGEACDGGAFTTTCIQLGFDGGSLTCSSSCQIETTLCTTCGNGAVEMGESCDDGLLNGTYDNCNTTCDGLADYCGDGTANGPEQCDGADLDGTSCATLGQGTGSLSCSNICSFDSSGCTGPPLLPNPGEVFVTEVMQNPAVQNDNSGEWFELFNATVRTLNLSGCRIVSSTASGPESFTITNAPDFAAGTHMVFARSANFAGPYDYVYNGAINLNNANDEIELLCVTPSAGVEERIDIVQYDDGATFPDPNGASMNLGLFTLGPTLNDDGSNWCEGAATFGVGDLGTPGGDNRICP